MTVRSPGAAALLLWTLACADSPNPAHQGPIIRDSAGVRIVENEVATWSVPWSVAEDPSLVIGSAEDDGGRALYRVMGALRLPDNRIVIANAGTYELRFYNEAGEFMSSSGGQGGGPGEFLSLEMISRSGMDSLVAVDVRNHRVSYFDIDGRFGRSVRLEPNVDIPLPRVLGVFRNGSLLATRGLHVLGARPPTRVERDEQHLFRYQQDGSTVHDLGPFPGAERDVVETGRVTPSGNPDVQRWPRPFGRSTTFASAGDRFYVANNAAYEIEVYSLDGRLTHLFRKTNSPLTVTDADLTALRDSISDRLMQRTWDNRPPPPETMPAYAPEIRIDSEMHLWVREYTRPGDRSWAYSVFTEDGIFVGTVPMPEGFTPLDIGRDYLLGLRRDELDVEYVQLHELRRGG